MLKELPRTADEVIELIRATSSIKFIFYCFEFVLSRFDGSDCAFPCSLFCLALGYVNCFILVVCVVNRPVDICDNGFDGTVVFRRHHDVARSIPALNASLGQLLLEIGLPVNRWTTFG
jgi:hypothetical protein